MSERYYWPEEAEVPSFVSDTGEDGTWRPLCDLHPGKVEMTYRFTPWGSWHCPECGVMHLIGGEDWPDAYKDACDACDAWRPENPTVEGRNDPGPWHEKSCQNYTEKEKVS